MTLCLFPGFPFPNYCFTPFSKKVTTFSYCCSSKTFHFKLKASLSEGEGENKVVSELLDGELITQISAAKDASEVLDKIAQKTGKNGGVVTSNDCCFIISAAFDRSNADLALNVFDAMRSTFDPGTSVSDRSPSYDRWRWSRPDVTTYTLLVRGLATLLRVSDALKVITNVCRMGISPSEELSYYCSITHKSNMQLGVWVGTLRQSCAMSKLHDCCCCCSATRWYPGCVLFKMPLPV